MTVTAKPTEASEAPRQRVPIGDPQYFQMLGLLIEEAEMLDGDRFDDWMSLLHPEIVYKMPTRVTCHRADGNGFMGGMGHFDDDYRSLELRVRRVRDCETAWAEDPPSRARRFVNNVRVDRIEGSEDLAVKSYLLLLRSRWDSPKFEILSAERQDIWSAVDAAPLLKSRWIYTDQATLGMSNMALFL